MLQACSNGPDLCIKVHVGIVPVAIFSELSSQLISLISGAKVLHGNDFYFS